MKRILLLAALAAVAIVGTAPAQDVARDGQPLYTTRPGRWQLVSRTADSAGVKYKGSLDSMVYVQPTRSLPQMTTVGGMYATDTTARALRTDSDGTLRVYEEWPAYNMSSWVNLASNVSLAATSPTGSPAVGWAKTYTYFPADKYTSITVHVQFTPNASDTANSGGAADSTMFEVIPFGKISNSEDGLDYLYDCDLATKGVNGFWIAPTAHDFSARPGYPVGSAYPTTGPTLWVSYGMPWHTPAASDRQWTVSFALTTKQGANFKDQYLGFYIVNHCNRTLVINSIDVFGKAN